MCHKLPGGPARTRPASLWQGTKERSNAVPMGPQPRAPPLKGPVAKFQEEQDESPSDSGRFQAKKSQTVCFVAKVEECQL